MKAEDMKHEYADQDRKRAEQERIEMEQIKLEQGPKYDEENMADSCDLNDKSVMVEKTAVQNTMPIGRTVTYNTQEQQDKKDGEQDELKSINEDD